MTDEQDREVEHLLEEEPMPELVEEDREGKLGLLELVYGVLFEPRRTLDNIVNKVSVGLALLVFTIVNAVTLLAGLVPVQGNFFGLSGGMSDMESYYSNAFAGSTMLVVLIGLFLLSCLVAFIYSGYLHLVAEFLGGKGRAVGVFVLVLLSELPCILMVPVNIITPFMGSFGWFLMVLTGIGVLVWSIALQILGLGKVHGLSGGRSALAVLSPYILGLLLLVLVIASFVAIIASMPTDFINGDYF